MTREEVYDEIRQIFGEVPGFFQKLPDSSLELEWHTWKRVEMDEGAIPNKYRQLIGVAVAAAHGCPFCVFYHTEAARLNGATDDELEEAVHFAKSTMGWSTYIRGVQIPLEEFKDEVRRAVEYVRQHQLAGAAVGGGM